MNLCYLYSETKPSTNNLKVEGFIIGYIIDILFVLFFISFYIRLC